MSTKIFKFILLGIMLCLPYYFVGQTITVNKQFSHDTVVSIDNYFKGKCSKAEFNGTIVLHSDTSVVRIMMTDTQGKKWLVAEAYPLIATDTILTMLRSCEETKYLAYNTNPVSLEIYMTDASCSITTIIFSNVLNLNYLTYAKTQKLNVENQKVIKMNANLEETEMLWRAALSDEVLIKYSTRAVIEGSYKGNINGYWYYNGGFYCDYSTYEEFALESKIMRSNDTLPNVQTHSFDWRTAHDADIPSSPYFDGNPDYTYVWTDGVITDTIFEYGNGWMTSTKSQQSWAATCPNGCFLFAFTGPLEAIMNLYYNQHLDYDISEQHIMDCLSSCGSCLPGPGGSYVCLANQAYNTKHKLINETAYPWRRSFSGVCMDTVIPSFELTRVQGQSIGFNENTIKRTLIKKGPLSACPRSDHACTLTGFKLIQPGDTIRTNGGWGYSTPYSHPDTLIIPEGHLLVGRTAWIFKENGSPTFCEGGYIMIVGKIGTFTETLDVSQPYYYNTPLTDSLNLSLTPEFHDYDGDGYYYWGIGPKPAACPGPAEEDCNDNDPFRLFYNESLFCTYDCDSVQQLISNDPIYVNNDTTIYGCVLTRPIIVMDGVLLTLRGEFQCTENVYILANIGANIYAVGATFNATCGENWRGFLGFANMDPSLYGGVTGRSYIQIKNCIIEDAVYAIAGDATAILRVQNSTFQNNITDIAIAPWYLSAYYSQVNLNSTSEFINCNFITPSSMYNDSCLESVSLSYCKDVDFENCSFVDEGVSGAVFSENNRIAFNTYKAGFNLEKNSFQNFSYAIKSVNSLYLPVTVSENDFVNCHYNVYLSQDHAAEIVNNIISFNNSLCDSTTANILPYGIYLDQCHDYQVEGNSIYMPNLTYNLYIRYSDIISGIVVNDSYNFDEQIYRNKIYGMAVGTQAIGLNRDATAPYPGVRILCNNFFKNVTDIFVTNNLTNPYPPGSPIGIAQLQGSLSAPAGNYFTISEDFIPADDSSGGQLPNDHKSAPIWSNIVNDALYFNYYHHDTTANSRLYPDSVYNVNRFASLVIYSDSTCLDHTISQGEDTIIILPELRILNNQIEEISETLENLTDGGSTQLTVAEIIMANDNSAWQTYLSLMDKSPYLSDESLKEVAKKDDGLTAPMVRDILVANPQAAKNAEILTLLDERLDELPEYMLEQIAAGMTEISPKEYLELQKSHLTKEYARKSSALLRQYLRETDIYTATEVENLLNLNPDYISSMKLAEYYASQSNYSGATGVLNSINTTNSMLQNEIDNLSGLFELMQTIESDTLLIDEEKLSSLRYYESEGGFAGAYARGLIQHFSQSDYYEPVFLPEIMINRKEDKDMHIEKGNAYLKVYPNPAKDFISIEYKLNDEIANPVIKIVSVNGQILKYQKLLNDQDIVFFEIKDLISGNYFVYLEDGNKKIESVIITVVK